MKRYFTKTFFTFLFVFFLILAAAFAVVFVAAGWQHAQNSQPVPNTAANG